MLQQVLTIVEQLARTGAFAAIIVVATVWLRQQYHRRKWRSQNLYPTLVEAELKLAQVEPVQLGEYFLIERMTELGDIERTVNAWERVYSRLCDNFRAAESIFAKYAYVLEPRDRDSLTKLHDAQQVASYYLARVLLSPNNDLRGEKETAQLVAHLKLTLRFIGNLKEAVSRQLRYSMP